LIEEHKTNLRKGIAVADNYLEFSEVIANLTEPEEAWLKEQLQTIRVFGDKEYPEDAVSSELACKNADWIGIRFLRDKKDYDPQWDDLGFEYAFHDDTCESRSTGWGRHLWFYTESCGNIDNVLHLVQKFLKKFRPDQCWSLSYAATCSKPRVGEFGGGAVFVTAKTICWQDGMNFIERKRAAFKAKNKAGKQQKKATHRNKGKT
jgi:hypothetical protein